MTKIYIDGSAGTTGLRIRERLNGREGLEILSLPAEMRKDSAAREEAITAADIAFYCPPGFRGMGIRLSGTERVP